MKKKTRVILNSVLVAVLAIGLICFGISEWTYYVSGRDYEEARQIAISTEETQPVTEATTEATEARESEAEKQRKAQVREVLQDPAIRELLQVDLDALREVNEDVIGWIQIPDTEISYPLLHWTDNDFYLEHTWKQTESFAGSIFMECESNPDFGDFNTIIYGHNMLDGSMFGGLHNFWSERYAKQHPSIYIVNDMGIFRYDIFSVQRVGIDTIMYATDLETEYRREEFLRFATDYSRLDLGKEPTVHDKILTLSTCSSAGHDSRWIVQGMLVEAGSYYFPEE